MTRGGDKAKRAARQERAAARQAAQEVVKAEERRRQADRERLARIAGRYTDPVGRAS